MHALPTASRGRWLLGAGVCAALALLVVLARAPGRVTGTPALDGALAPGTGVAPPERRALDPSPAARRVADALPQARDVATPTQRFASGRSLVLTPVFGPGLPPVQVGPRGAQLSLVRDRQIWRAQPILREDSRLEFALDPATARGVQLTAVVTLQPAEFLAGLELRATAPVSLPTAGSVDLGEVIFRRNDAWASGFVLASAQRSLIGARVELMPTRDHPTARAARSPFVPTQSTQLRPDLRFVFEPPGLAHDEPSTSTPSRAGPASAPAGAMAPGSSSSRSRATGSTSSSRAFAQGSS